MEVSAVLRYNIWMEYKKQSHAVYYAQNHIVVSTKYRKKVLRAGMGDYLKKKVLQVSRFHPEIEIIELLWQYVPLRHYLRRKPRTAGVVAQAGAVRTTGTRMACPAAVTM